MTPNELTPMPPVSELSHYDYGVIVFYFAYMTLIGWLCRKFIGNTSDYFRGGGKMLWWMAGSSAFMVAFSAWTFTGAAGKAYEDGPIVAIVFFGNAVGFFFNFLFFGPRFRQMRVVTCLEAVRARFGRVNEQFFTWLQLPLGILYAGIWLNGLGVFVSAVFQLDLQTTIILVGLVVLLMAAVGGSWAVVTSDFVQLLILMPLTVVAAVLALIQIGGVGSFIRQVPSHYVNWNEVARNEMIWLWIVAVLIKQFISTNNMMDAYRYLNVKDSRHARRGALLAMALFLVGPMVWFIPPMVARLTQPDLGALFPHLAKPNEAAFIASCLSTLPTGMVGLLVCGIFAATMSSMDSGLNKNAGFFVKNFYQPILRPHAQDRELLWVAKAATLVLGLLVVLAALTFSSWKRISLFDLMLQFGALVAVPYTIPLIWGLLIKRAPSWAGWTTVLVGFACSLSSKAFLTSAWAEGVLGWTASPLNAREQSDWALISSVLLNALVCSAWFLASCLFWRQRTAREVERVEAFFEQVRTPVDFDREVGGANDAQQYRLLGLLCLIYGGFTSLLVFIPNPPSGRLAILACGASILAVGGWLHWSARKGERLQPQPEPPEDNYA